MKCDGQLEVVGYHSAREPRLAVWQAWGTSLGCGPYKLDQNSKAIRVQVAPSPGLRTRSLSATLGNAGNMMEDSPSLLHGKTETTAASQHPMQKTRRKRTKVWCQWRPFMNFDVRCVPWTALDAVLNIGCWGLGAISLSLSPSLRASPNDQPDLHGDYSLLCAKGVVFKLHRSSNVNPETSGQANIVRSVQYICVIMCVIFCLCVCVIVCDCVWLCVIVCVIVCDCVWLCVIVCDCVWLCVCDWLCVIDCVWLIVCDWLCVWLCVIVCDWLCVWLIVCEIDCVWDWLCVRLIVCEIDCVWDWWCVRLIVCEIDCVWDWLCVRLIVCEIDCVWDWLCVRLMECEIDWVWDW